MKNHSEQHHHVYEKLAVTNKALESISDAVIIADQEGVAIYVNAAFSHAFDYSLNELNITGIPNVLFHKPTLGKNIFAITRKEGTWKGEIELQRKNGEIVPFLLHVDDIRNDQGKLIGFISICTDITDHKRINAIQQEQEVMAEAQLEIAKLLTSTLDLREVFSRILDSIDQVVPNNAANIILIQDGKAQLVDRDDYSDKSAIQKLKAGETPPEHYDDLRRILETDTPLIVSNTQQYLETHDDMQSRTPWLNSHIGIPIRLRERIIGFLNVDSIYPGAFTEHHVEQLELFAEQATIAIHNAQLHERAQQVATLEERQRLARNLHDAVSQTLFSANLLAEALPRLWEKQPEAVFPRLEEIRNLNRGALAKMRTLLLELNPERLLETSLDELFQQLADGVLGQARIDVTLNVTGNLEVPAAVHTAIYYIAQEALNNVIKHSRAKSVTIDLLKNENQITLRIEDDGRGLDTDKIVSTSLGLSNIRERAQSTGAHLKITSEIGEGTQILTQWEIRGE